MRCHMVQWPPVDMMCEDENIQYEDLKRYSGVEFCHVCPVDAWLSQSNEDDVVGIIGRSSSSSKTTSLSCSRMN